MPSTSWVEKPPMLIFCPVILLTRQQPSWTNLRNKGVRALDWDGHVYLADYTGGGIYADSQLDAHFDLLRHNTFGNP